MAIIKKHKAKITQITNHGEGVYTLELDPQGSRFKYTPGQFLHISLDEEYDGSGQWPESRCFSMQSNPEADTIKITYAVKGRFTQQMANTLKVGSEVWLKMPYGDLFDRPHVKENTVFVAGGTGVTPFLSLFNHVGFSEYHNPVLYLGLRDERYNFYESELEKAKQINPRLHLNFVYQNTEGLLNIETILKNTNKNASFFVSGPPVMIKAFKNYLINNGISENNVLTDDWE